MDVLSCDILHVICALLIVLWDWHPVQVERVADYERLVARSPGEVCCHCCAMGPLGDDP